MLLVLQFQVYPVLRHSSRKNSLLSCQSLWRSLQCFCTSSFQLLLFVRLRVCPLAHVSILRWRKTSGLHVSCSSFCSFLLLLLPAPSCSFPSSYSIRVEHPISKWRHCGAARSATAAAPITHAASGVKWQSWKLISLVKALWELRERITMQRSRHAIIAETQVSRGKNVK